MEAIGTLEHSTDVVALNLRRGKINDDDVIRRSTCLDCVTKKERCGVRLYSKRATKT